jgi:site-specific DNA-methyltransferase (adenine-specific)
MDALTVATQRVLLGDCLTILRTMPAASVFITVFSPPYNLGKRYNLYNDNKPEHEYLAWMCVVAKELRRLLRPDGHVFLNIGFDSKHPRRHEDVALEFEKHFARQNTIIWVKALAIDARSMRNETLLEGLHAWTAEHGLTIPKNAEKQFCVHMREVLQDYTIGHFRSFRSQRYLESFWEPVYHLSPYGKSLIDPLAIGVKYVYEDQPARFGHLRKLHSPGATWHIPYDTKQSNADVDNHPATYPVELAERCLRLADVPSDGLVLDPFAGIGTTLIAAKNLGMNAVGIEIDPTYAVAACRRLGLKVSDAAQ